MTPDKLRREAREFWTDGIIAKDDMLEASQYQADGWDLTHVIEHSEYERVLNLLSDAVKVIELIRDIPGLGGMDYKSTKRWREESMKSIDYAAKEFLKKVEGE